MPQIIVAADRGAAFGEGAVTFREWVNVADFESQHFAAQLVERLGWAVEDADQAERIPDAAEDADRAERAPDAPEDADRAQPIPDASQNADRVERSPDEPGEADRVGPPRSGSADDAEPQGDGRITVPSPA